METSVSAESIGVTPLRTLKGHRRSVLGVAFSSDGQTLISVSWDKTVRDGGSRVTLVHTP